MRIKIILPLTSFIIGLIAGAVIVSNLQTPEGDAGLKTYTNEYYGFSFQFPSDWYFQEDDPIWEPMTTPEISPSWRVSLYSGDPMLLRKPTSFDNGEVSITFIIYSSPEELDITSSEELTNPQDLSNEPNYTFAGQPARKYIEDFSSTKTIETASIFSERIFIILGEYLFETSVSGKSLESVTNASRDVSKILDSVSIIPK